MRTPTALASSSLFTKKAIPLFTMNPAQIRNADNLIDDPHGLAIYEEKPNTDHLETASVDEKAANTNADYSGFTQKTDPKEIKLVRKLDMYIMVSPSLTTRAFADM
jgi:hypothetical protein